MPKTNIGFDSGGHIGKISFEVQNVHAIGGPEFPKLVFMLELQVFPLKTPSQPPQPAHPLTWLYLSGEFCSPDQRAVAGFRDEVNLYADASHSPERQFRLEIPLDLLTIERIEQTREGNLRAALKLRGFFAIHVTDASGKGLGVHRFETATLEPIVFMIPKSQWVEQLLPQLGYGRLELIEVRISNGIRAEGLPKAVQEVREARAYLANGDWEKVVAHCRNTLEAILDSRPLQLPSVSKFSTKADTFIHEHLASLGEKQSKLLAEEMKLLWEVCSKAAHPNPPDYFKRADADFIVRNTTAILEYVGRLLV
jgi:hypothetical protein